MTDREYIEAIAAGDQFAFASLYNMYRSEFKGYMRNQFAVSDDEIADVYQDSCVAMWGNIQEGKLTAQALNSSLKTYLFSIGKYKVYSLKRRNRVVTTDKDLSYISQDFADTAKEFEQSEQRDVIKRIVEQMQDPCRRILSLFYWEELSCREIVERTEYKNENSVKSQKAKCMRKVESTVSTIFND